MSGVKVSYDKQYTPIDRSNPQQKRTINKDLKTHPISIIRSFGVDYLYPNFTLIVLNEESVVYR